MATQETMWLPQINPALCDGCGICIAQCPQQILGWQAGKASLKDPAACLYCATCEDHCPRRAVELPLLIIRPQPDRESYHEQTAKS